jgi:hypothetical protein
MDDREPFDAPTLAVADNAAISEAVREPLSRHRLAVPDIVPESAPVYAAGSVHGPVYDALGNRIERPAPPVVGTLTPAGKFEPLAGHHRLAA